MLADKNDLIVQFIEANPYRPGIEEAVLVGSGIPVWALIGAMTLARVRPPMKWRRTMRYPSPPCMPRSHTMSGIG